MIKVAVCDDAPEITGNIEETLRAFDSALFDVAVFFSADALISSLQKQRYDFFVLDIELPTSSGIDIAKAIREQDLNVPIVFLTNYVEYMEDVFQVQTFDYILKPITKEKFFPVLRKVVKYLELDDEYFSFSHRKKTYHLKLSDIICFEKQRRNVIIRDKKQQYQVIMSTSELLGKLNNNFVQVHTSYVINTKFIKEIGAGYIILAEASVSMEIPVSRKFRNIAREQIIMQMRSKL